MSYFLVKRINLDGKLQFPETLLLATPDECVKRANDDRADYLIQDQNGQVINYRLAGRWKS